MNVGNEDERFCWQNTEFPVTGLAAPVMLHNSDPDIQTEIEFNSEPSSAASSTTAVRAAIKAGNVNKVITGIRSESKVSSTPIISPTVASVTAANRNLVRLDHCHQFLGSRRFHPMRKRIPFLSPIPVQMMNRTFMTPVRILRLQCMWN